MIVRPSTVHEDAEAIPLLLKEGPWVVDPDAEAETHHPCRPLQNGQACLTATLPPRLTTRCPFLRRGGESFSWPEGASGAARGAGWGRLSPILCSL